MEVSSSIPKIYRNEFKGAQSAPLKTMPAKNSDTVELSSITKKDNNGYSSILGLLAISAAAATGGIWGGKEIYKKYFDKLACGIKRGQIDDALYNFIKNNDPKGALFNNKDGVLEISSGLTDEKLVILKQLAKMKTTGNVIRIKETHRFTLNEIKSLLEEANENNIKYLEQLAQKSAQHSNYQGQTFTPSQILQVLKCINNKNQKVAKELIDVTNIRPDEIERLTECLKSVDEKNVDIWRILLSTRKKSSKTELKLRDLSKLAKKVEETQTPKCAEVLLNAEKKNGSGMYIHDVEDILTILPKLTEDNSEVYRTFYEIKAVSDINATKCAELLPAITKDNVDLVEAILTKTEKNGEYVIFHNYNYIKTILESIDSQNKDIAQRLINLIDNRYCTNISYFQSDSALIDVLSKAKTNSELEKIKEILDKEYITNFDKFLQEFSKPY